MHGFIEILKPKQMLNAVIKVSILVLCWLCKSQYLKCPRNFSESKAPD